MGKLFIPLCSLSPNAFSRYFENQWTLNVGIGAEIGHNAEVRENKNGQKVFFEPQEINLEAKMRSHLSLSCVLLGSRVKICAVWRAVQSAKRRLEVMAGLVLHVHISFEIQFHSILTSLRQEWDRSSICHLLTENPFEARESWIARLRSEIDNPNCGKNGFLEIWSGHLLSVYFIRFFSNN